MRACAVVVRARTSVELSIPQQTTIRGKLIRRIASNAIRAGLTSDRFVRAVKDAAVEYLKPAPNVFSSRPITFNEIVNRLFGPHREPTVIESQQRVHGQWRCDVCQKYVGSGQGVRDHSIAHGARSIREVKAVLESTSATALPLPTAEAFTGHVARALRMHGAAKTIQAHWRTAIACPDFDVCKRRLQTEANEFLDVRW